MSDGNPVSHNAGVAGSSPAPAMDYRADGGGSATPSATHGLTARILARVQVDPGSGCWLWGGAKNAAGYGTIRVGRSVQYTHRLMLEAAGGALTPGLFACHTCDTPACCNPAHLYPGTAKQNSQDALARLRWPLQRMTHCQRGHEFTEATTYIVPATSRRAARRSCRPCRGIRLAAARMALPLAVALAGCTGWGMDEGMLRSRCEKRMSWAKSAAESSAVLTDSMAGTTWQCRDVLRGGAR